MVKREINIVLLRVEESTVGVMKYELVSTWVFYIGKSLLPQLSGSHLPNNN